jgi:hypothetical protein
LQHCHRSGSLTPTWPDHLILERLAITCAICHGVVRCHLPRCVQDAHAADGVPLQRDRHAQVLDGHAGSALQQGLELVLLGFCPCDGDRPRAAFSAHTRTGITGTWQALRIRSISISRLSPSRAAPAACAPGGAAMARAWSATPWSTWHSFSSPKSVGSIE